MKKPSRPEIRRANPFMHETMQYRAAAWHDGANAYFSPEATERLRSRYAGSPRLVYFNEGFEYARNARESA